MASPSMYTVASQAIDTEAGALYKLSQEIWNEPELAFKEFKAHNVLTAFLEKHGFDVTKSYLMDTAFRAEFCGAEGGPIIAVFCEYDALPGIGHGCGHNLIAEVGVATALGVKAALEQTNANRAFKGKLVILGSPAEEGGGGKVVMIDHGIFKSIDAAVMAHPSSKSIARPNCLGLRDLRVQFYGKASHASSAPSEGVNALDAVIAAYTSISNLRQQLPSSHRVHGVITNGGAKPNIIPDLAEMYYYVRAPTTKEVAVLYEKVQNCFKGAALATGCSLKFFEDVPFYKHVISNEAMSKRLERYCEQLGLNLITNAPFGGSTDMGNVSHEIPSIHPNFFIGKVPLHSIDFQKVAGTQEAQENTLKMSKILANIVLDLLTDAEFLKDVKADFQHDLASIN